MSPTRTDSSPSGHAPDAASGGSAGGRIIRRRAPRDARTEDSSAGATPAGHPAGSRRGRRRRRARAEARGATAAWTPGYASHTEAPAHLLEQAFAKQRWLERWAREGYPKGRLLTYAREYARVMQIPEPEIPPTATLHTWAARYRAYGIVGLINHVRRDAGHSRSLQRLAPHLARVGKPSAEQLVETYLIGKAGTPAGLQDFLLRQVPGSAGRRILSYWTCWRAARAFKAREPHLWAMATRGAAYVDQHFKISIPQAYQPGGYCLAMDSTVLDVWVRIPDLSRPDAWRAIRPVLTLVIDQGTRLLVTFQLSLSAVDSGICCGVLRKAIRQEANYPQLLSTGVPFQISVDKGAEHQGAFAAALARYGIECVPRLPDNPQGGARVERLIDTVNTEVLLNLPGYSKLETFLDPYRPPERDGKRGLASLKYESYRRELPVESLLSLPELERTLLAWGLVYKERPPVSIASHH